MIPEEFLRNFQHPDQILHEVNKKGQESLVNGADSFKLFQFKLKKGLEFFTNIDLLLAFLKREKATKAFKGNKVEPNAPQKGQNGHESEKSRSFWEKLKKEDLMMEMEIPKKRFEFIFSIFLWIEAEKHEESFIEKTIGDKMLEIISENYQVSEEIAWELICASVNPDSLKIFGEKRQTLMKIPKTFQIVIAFLLFE